MSPVWAVVVVVLALAVSGGLGWFVAAGVLRLADRAPRTVAPPAGPKAAPEVDPGADPEAGPGAGPATRGGPDGAAARARLRGGTWIGVLERLAVTGTLLAGEPGGVAVVVAIKGLGRYPELRSGSDPGVSERFVIGTLASLVWAGALGVLGRWLLTR
ncbi:hypothetical protein [Cellulomonas denverensis]|uniref:Uncharacterized protein n=1 Tax=Cellulomonas denverensis TaxID=264297 RepID=A0A7X6QY94_9CELL|nr:hypothetical protein [Cellulomonas denverensis]NKY21878.1 hypothetical protein [Cellulomonas denverensis]GIG24232.1 hypothetical protein Cde04nite_04760 [Cellulomonas denverensis]